SLVMPGVEVRRNQVLGERLVELHVAAPALLDTRYVVRVLREVRDRLDAVRRHRDRRLVDLEREARRTRTTLLRENLNHAVRCLRPVQRRCRRALQDLHALDRLRWYVVELRRIALRGYVGR